MLPNVLPTGQTESTEHSFFTFPEREKRKRKSIILSNPHKF